MTCIHQPGDRPVAFPWHAAGVVGHATVHCRAVLSPLALRSLYRQSRGGRDGDSFDAQASPACWPFRASQSVLPGCPGQSRYPQSAAAMGYRNPHQPGQPGTAGCQQPARSPGHRAKPGAIVARIAAASAGHQPDQQRWPRQGHLAIHARHAQQPCAGAHRWRKSRLGEQWWSGLAGPAAGVDRACRGGARAAFRPVWLGSHWRGHPDFHASGR